jgi:hypothetical protein
MCYGGTCQCGPCEADPSLAISPTNYGGSCIAEWSSCGWGLAGAGEDINLTFTFSEAMNGFTSGDITVVNGTVKSLAGTDGDSVYTAVVTVDGGCSDCVVDVSVAANAAVSVASSAGNSASSYHFGAGNSYYHFCNYWDLWPGAWNWWNFYWGYNACSYGHWHWWHWWWDSLFWTNRGYYYPLNETVGSVAFNNWWRVTRYQYGYWYWWNNWATISNELDAWLISADDFAAETYATKSFTFDDSGKKCPATTTGNPYSLYFGGNDTIFTQISYPFHFGYGWHYWPWQYYYGYSWYYNYWNLWQTYTLSFWVKSDAPSPLDQTLFFGSNENGTDVLRISLTGSTTNNLLVATTNTVLRSDVPFDITHWNHVVVRFQYKEPVALYVNDIDVGTGNGGAGLLIQSDYPQNWNLMIGSQGTFTSSFSITNSFKGYLDEIKIYPGWGSSGDGLVNTYCEEASPSLSQITAVPSNDAAFTVVDYDDYVNLYTVGKWPGKYNVLLQKSSIPIVKAPTDLTQNRSWLNVSANTDATNSKVVVHFDDAEVATHGHDPAADKHTIYAKKNATGIFRLCPDATTLNDVTDACANGVLFSGPFPQEQSVGGSTVTVGTIDIDGVTYWYASGVTGSGGEGEAGSGSGTSVPFFPLWSIPVIGVIGWYLLKKEGWIQA